METYNFTYYFPGQMQNYYLIKSTKQIKISSLGTLIFPSYAAVFAGYLSFFLFRIKERFSYTRKF